MQDINWVLIGVTAALSVFITVMRVNEFRKHTRLLAEVKAKGADLEVVYQDKSLMAVYTGMTLLVLFISFFLQGETVEKAAMSLVFVMLIGSEVVSAWIHSKLYAGPREFVYGEIHERYRSLKSFTPKGKRQVIVSTLNKDTHTLPKAVADALQATIAQHKTAKK